IEADSGAVEDTDTKACQPEPERCDDGADNDCDEIIDEGTPETCNGLDDDCDGHTDEDVLASFYEDHDGDGVGSGEATLSCEAPDGFVTEPGDCNDSDAALSPKADEVCDG